MSDTPWTELCIALGKGPAILLLGQGYRRLRGDDDEFLIHAARHFGGGAAHDYSSLLDLVESSKRIEEI